MMNLNFSRIFEQQFDSKTNHIYVSFSFFNSSFFLSFFLSFFIFFFFFFGGGRHFTCTPLISADRKLAKHNLVLWSNGIPNEMSADPTLQQLSPTPSLAPLSRLDIAEPRIDRVIERRDRTDNVDGTSFGKRSYEG